MTKAYPQRMEQVALILKDNELFVSKEEEGRLVFDRIDLEAKEVVSTIDMGPMEGLEMEFVKKYPPIFAKKLGVMNDFYILPRTGECLELGVLYKDQEGAMKTFEMSKIVL